MFNLMLTSTRKCQALGPECTILSRYDVHCIPSPSPYVHLNCVILSQFAQK